MTTTRALTWPTAGSTWTGKALSPQWSSTGTGTPAPDTCPASAFSPEAVPVSALQALVSGIQPAVVHSVSMVMELEDARKARGKARTDAAMDIAKDNDVRKSGKLSDGAEEVLMGASRQRLLDLKPGSGHHGASYALYISYSVESEDELLATADLIEAAAADAGIEFIDWMDHRNDLALITTMPFTRGIR